MQENLQEMVKNLNSSENEETKVQQDPGQEEIPTTEIQTEPSKSEDQPSTPEINLINFYDWFEKFTDSIHNISRVKAEVSNINPKDNMIFKVKKGNNDDMELVSFYNPSLRPVLNLPPVYLKIFKNDTFEILHQYNDEIFIKSYGVKTGLILVYCANVDGKIIPYEKTKIKKNVTSIKLVGYDGISNEIKEKLANNVDEEKVQLLYKQASKFKEVFTTKEKTVDWFIQKQSGIVDINHLLKIDDVLIHVI